MIRFAKELKSVESDYLGDLHLINGYLISNEYFISKEHPKDKFLTSMADFVEFTNGVRRKRNRKLLVNLITTSKNLRISEHYC